MNNVASARINTFGPSPKAGFESPSEQLITLTYGQLQDLLAQAVHEAIQPLQDEVAQLREEIDQNHQEIAALENLQEQDTNRICLDIAYDRQRLAKLENPKKKPGKTDLSRAEKIEKYLTARPDHKANFETLRGHLDVDKFALNDAIRTLMEASPGRFGITRTPGDDKRKRTLTMLMR